jgi:hypothetical protein
MPAPETDIFGQGIPLHFKFALLFQDFIHGILAKDRKAG